MELRAETSARRPSSRACRLNWQMSIRRRPAQEPQRRAVDLAESKRSPHRCTTSGRLPLPVADLRRVRYSLHVVPLPVNTLPVGHVVMLLGIGVGVMSLRRWPRAFKTAVAAAVVGAVVLVVGLVLR